MGRSFRLIAHSGGPTRPSIEEPPLPVSGIVHPTDEDGVPKSLLFRDGVAQIPSKGVASPTVPAAGEILAVLKQGARRPDRNPALSQFVHARRFVVLDASQKQIPNRIGCLRSEVEDLLRSHCPSAEPGHKVTGHRDRFAAVPHPKSSVG